MSLSTSIRAAHLGIVLAVLLPAAAQAQPEGSERRRANPDVELDILNPNGSTRIIGWDKPEVAITGRHGRHPGMVISGEGGRIKIRPGEQDNPASGGAAIEVRVLWGGDLLRVDHLAPPRSFFIGDAACDFVVDGEPLGTARFPLIPRLRFRLAIPSLTVCRAQAQATSKSRAPGITTRSMPPMGRLRSLKFSAPPAHSRAT